jgi:hypothetical protein
VAPGGADLTEEDPSVATDPGLPPGDQLAGGQLSTAISNALVRIQREYLGRGPTKARAMIRDNVVVMLMEDTLTT